MSLGPDHLSTTEFADAVHAPVRTVKFWCKRGWVQSVQTPGGHYRIPRAEVERVRNGEPLAATAA